MKNVNSIKSVLLAALSIAALDVYASDAALLKCRGIADNSKRLQCYDAIETGRAAPAVSATPVAPTAPVSATAPRPGAAPVARAGVPPPAQDASEFGMPPKQTAVGVDRIESRVKGRLENWQQGTRIRLENGQLWQVTDDSRGLCQCDSPRVVVTRGAFGTYFLEIEGKGNSPRVKRLE